MASISLIGADELQSTATGSLKFSIIIPTYNEAGGIERLIVSLSDVFRVHRLAGEIIVVDDVLTTGATVDACARALLRAGAAKVDVLVFARVVATRRVVDAFEATI